MAKFNRAKLSNGLTIIHEKRDVPVTTVMLAVKFGAMYELEEEKGISHFIEHLCFKGTEKRTAKQIALELEGVGGELNAFTHEEVTAYHVKLPSSHLELGIDVLSDIFFNPSFPQEEIEKEGNVICEEIKMYKDSPRHYTLDKVKSNLYKKPFGTSIAGSIETVKSMTRKQLKEKHDKLYVPENSVLCVVGNNDFEDVLKLSENYASIERKGEKIKEIEVERFLKQNSESRKDVMQTNLCIGFHMPKFKEKSRYAGTILANILGEGMSSKLFTEVREKLGLVYGIKVDYEPGRNYGYMIIWAGTTPENTEKVKEISLKEFEKLKDLTQKELDDAKVAVLGSRQVDSEGSVETAVELIFEEFAEKAENYYEYEKNINQVTLEDVKSLVKTKEFGFFALGP